MLPTGIHFDSYAAEARILKTRRSQVWTGLLVLAVLALPLVGSTYLVGVLTDMFITLIAVYGLYVTVGMAGQINVAQSAFVGVGAFTAAKLSGYGLSFLVVVPLAALVTAVVAIGFGVAACRVKGFYLALTTLAAQVMFPIVVLALPEAWLGGLVGMSVAPAALGSFTFGTPVRLYYLVAAIMVIATVAAFNLPRSRLGRAMMAVRDNDVAAEVMGIPVVRIKLTAFFAGSLFAGVAGACTGYFLQFVTVSSFTLFTSIWYLGMLIVGGTHSAAGAILGVVFITLLQEGLHALANAALQSGAAGGGLLFSLTSIALGASILVALVFEPRGLAHRWSVIRTGFQLWPFPRN